MEKGPPPADVGSLDVNLDPCQLEDLGYSRTLRIGYL